MRFLKPLVLITILFAASLSEIDPYTPNRVTPPLIFGCKEYSEMDPRECAECYFGFYKEPTTENPNHIPLC